MGLVVMRDVLGIARIRQREALPRLLRQFGAQTSQLLNTTKAGQAAGLETYCDRPAARLSDCALGPLRAEGYSEDVHGCDAHADVVADVGKDDGCDRP